MEENIMIEVSEQGSIKNCPTLNKWLIDCFEEILEKVKCTDIIRENTGTIVEHDEQQVRIDMQMYKTCTDDTYGEGTMYNIQAQLAGKGKTTFACVLVRYFNHSSGEEGEIIKAFKNAMRDSCNGKKKYVLTIA